MSPAKKSSTKKSTLKKSTAKKSPATKSAIKKSPAKKAVTKKSPAKKKPAPPPPSNPPTTGTGAAGAPPDFIVSGTNAAALFTLKVYRGEGMALLAMNWKNNQKPPANFAGFAIEYKEPAGTAFFALKNRLSFLDNDNNVNPNILSTRLSPIQKFRWTHFPFHPDIPGLFTYRVTPVFMGTDGQLSYGDFQEASIRLESETYPGKLNIGFTRGFISSQAFVSRWGQNGGVGTIIPVDPDLGLDFVATDPNAAAAQDWMGFEGRRLLVKLLDDAVADPTSKVHVTAYDFNLPELLNKFEALGTRLKIIIDNSDKHGNDNSPETLAAARLVVSAGEENVQRQKVGGLQHNKTIAVTGKVMRAIGGSTNMSWRGFYVQNNNAVMLSGAKAVQLFLDQFDNLWNNLDSAPGFGGTPSAAGWQDLGLTGIDAKIAFSPHKSANALLKKVADDIATTGSSLLYSLAFLYQTPGVIKNAVVGITDNNKRFVYGISDKNTGGLDLKTPDGNAPISFPAALLTNVPEPFKQEAAGGSGVRMHHKFVVIDFDQPTARVYTGSYNFSIAADTKNGENLFLIRDRRVAVSYMIQAVIMFDHYEWRDAVANAATPNGKLYLKLPPKPNTTDVTWFDEDYKVPQKIRDREIFGN